MVELLGLDPTPVEDVDFLPGDFNRDGIVDTADYVVWRKTFGQEVARGTGGEGAPPRSQSPHCVGSET